VKRVPWGFQSKIANCFILIPENSAERDELTYALEDRGVMNSMAFSKNGTTGRLNVPDRMEWASDGAARVTVTVKEEAKPIDAWFWLIECDDQDGRPHAWWSTKHDIEQAENWA
jgi:hypothetical protein